MADRAVLDASAVLTLLQQEPGHPRVREALRDGECLISTVNLAEVATRLSLRGLSPAEVEELCDVPNLTVVALTRETALSAASLAQEGRRLGLSLGDRVCLALGQERGCIVLTADRIWAQLGGDHSIELLR